MSNVVGSINAIPTDGAAQFFKPSKPIIWSVAVILVLWLMVAAWLYLGVNTPVPADTRLRPSRVIQRSKRN